MLGLESIIISLSRYLYSNNSYPNNMTNRSASGYIIYVTYNMFYDFYYSQLKLGITVPKALFGKGPFSWTKVLFLTKIDLTKNLRPSKFQSGAT